MDLRLEVLNGLLNLLALVFVFHSLSTPGLSGSAVVWVSYWILLDILVVALILERRISNTTAMVMVLTGFL